jgi:tetratricopeptide (TPR) repeat protein
LGDTKFRAFISYSHADEEWGAWLQRSLERFRTPRDLARLISAQGRPVRLAPVFRDREDLPVAGSLNEAIRQALADSEFQIVLCSPNAAKSRWVNEEIKLFNRLHGPGRTFAIIISGEPGGGDRECFPPALRFKLDADGEPTPEPAEPLAADAREEGDGKRYALLKTAAGMLGVGLDDLVRREARERARKTRAAVGVISTFAASMTFAAVFAFNQKNEAQRARGEAEDLIEFMLSDLKDRLDPVGRLDILEEVGGKVLAYYDNQDLKSLDADALSRRARGLMQLGAVDQARGDLDAALKAYEAAFASTQENLRRAPNNPDRIFDHAQSVFYVANVAVERNDFDRGERGFLEYQALAQRLLNLDGADPKWRLEAAYARSNLGALEFKRGAYAASLPYFEESAAIREKLAQEAPTDRATAFAHANALSWLAYAQLASGDNASAIETLQRQLAIYQSFDSNFEGVDYQSLEKRITAERRLAEGHLGLGNLPSARVAIERAAKIGDLLLKREPENMNSLANVGITERRRSYLAGLEGDKPGEIASAQKALDIARRVFERDRSHFASNLNFGWALVRLISARPADAAPEAGELTALLDSTPLPKAGEAVDFYVTASLALVVQRKAIGDLAGAQSRVETAIEAVRNRHQQLTAGAQTAYAELLAEAGEFDDADEILSALFQRGVRTPEILKLHERLAARSTR